MQFVCHKRRSTHSRQTRKLIEIITIYEPARIITQPSGESLGGSQAMKYSLDTLFSLSIKKIKWALQGRITKDTEAAQDHRVVSWHLS